VAAQDRIFGFTAMVLSNSSELRCGSSFIVFGIMSHYTSVLGITLLSSLGA
jgi:hypothetical protein